MAIVKIEAIRSDLFARRGRTSVSDVLIDSMAEQANKMKVNSYYCLPREFSGRYVKGTINGASKRQKLSALLRVMNENSIDREWKIRLLRDGNQYAVTCEPKPQKPVTTLADEEPQEEIELDADDELEDTTE